MKDLARPFSLFVLTLLILGTSTTFARGGASRTGDPLCNDGKAKGSRGEGCRAILATMTSESSCTKPILDRIANAAARGKFGGMDKFCPNYSKFNSDPTKRALIWRNIVAALVMEESSWNRYEPGDGGRSHGLLQIGYSNTEAGPYRCACASARRDIFNAAANAQCGTHIFLYNVARDMQMGGGPAGRSGSYGAARFFGPYGNGQSHKRARMAAKVASYCRNLPVPTSEPVQAIAGISRSAGSQAISERQVAPPTRRSSVTSGFLFD